MKTSLSGENTYFKISAHQKTRIRTACLSLLAGALALGSTAQAQLFWDPSNSNCANLGGTGTWYSFWCNGTNDSGWDGVSQAVFTGSNGVVTLNADANAPSGMVFLVDGYIVAFNNHHLNLADPNPVVDVTNGVTATFAGASSATGGTIRKLGQGTLVLGDGTVLANGYGGVGDYVAGTVVLKNDPSGVGASSWYTNLRGAKLAGTGSADAAMDFNSGTISPGATPTSTGKLTNNGPLHQYGSSATLAIKLGGLTQGAAVNGYDVFNVVGPATLDSGSVVAVTLIGGFTPAVGNSFDILVASNIVATVNNLVFSLPPALGLSWNKAIVSTGGLQALRLTAVQGAAPSLPPRPVAWLTFDNTFVDQTGNGHDGTPSFDPSPASLYDTNVPNANAGSADFHLYGGMYAPLTSPTAFNLNTGNPFTIAGWVMLTNSASYPTIAIKAPASYDCANLNQAGLMVAPSHKLHFDVACVGYVESGASVTDGQWHHVAVVYNGTSYQLYVDAVADGSGTFAAANEGAHSEPAWNMTVGGNFGDEARLDEIAFWNKALTPAQVLAVMYLGPGSGTTLSITKTDSSHVTLTWNTLPFHLQQNGDISVTNGWTDVLGATNSPSIQAIGTAKLFYRAKKN